MAMVLIRIKHYRFVELSRINPSYHKKLWSVDANI